MAALYSHRILRPGRIDHRFSEKDQVHLTESYNMSSTLYPTTAGGVGQPMLNGVAGMEFDSNQMQAWATTWVHTFSPTFFNETILSFKRNERFGGEVEGTNWPDKLGLPNPFGTTRWPQINTLGLGNFAYITNDTKKNHENYIILDDNFTKIKGKHELLFGVHVRRDYLNILAQQRWPAPQLNRKCKRPVGQVYRRLAACRRWFSAEHLHLTADGKLEFYRRAHP